MKEKYRDRNLIELLKDTQTKELDIIKKLLKVHGTTAIAFSALFTDSTKEGLSSPEVFTKRYLGIIKSIPRAIIDAFK
ncbi:hypothetical protein A2395_00395 [Candidatus Amesbacteria bacterium RIFOXYB1_FULL_47_9]|uniref:Uncharacterized protein n=1 Tax=Candidatus Amesbacteria bacterium RIFOXYB1_FULL_47_9 TaxID=1797266 RepID=A0A1F4ZX46_9BACT|nr:MAG: hypothetical protein A2395_00395 [Candidatus Amesbacteria bacterium RIFOXYB1_FULL_47_9]